MTVEAVICLPLPLLGQSGNNFQLPWGNLGIPQSSILDALPGIGSIFCDLAPPRRRFFKKIDQNVPKFYQDIIKFSIPGLLVGCTDLSPLRTHFYRTGLQASKSPSLQGSNWPRRVTRSANNPPRAVRAGRVRQLVVFPAGGLTCLSCL